MPDTYTCSVCGGVLEKGWTDAEAKSEKEHYFGHLPNDQCRIVCDDCWQLTKPEKNPELYAEFKRRN